MSDRYQAERDEREAPARKLPPVVDAAGNVISSRDPWKDIALLGAVHLGLSSSSRPNFRMVPLEGVKWKVYADFERDGQQPASAGPIMLSAIGSSVIEAAHLLRAHLVDEITMKAKALLGTLTLAGAPLPMEDGAMPAQPDFMGVDTKRGDRDLRENAKQTSMVVETTAEVVETKERFLPMTSEEFFGRGTGRIG